MKTHKKYLLIKKNMNNTKNSDKSGRQNLEKLTIRKQMEEQTSNNYKAWKNNLKSKRH